MAQRELRQRGQILILFGLALPVLLGFLGLGIDFGYFMALRQRMQSAADLAAMNGAYCIYDAAATQCASAASFTGSGGDEATGMALSVAKANGFQTGFDGVTVTVTQPSGLVRVQIFTTQPTIFLNAIGFGQFTLEVAAAAAVQTGTANVALLALDEEDCGALEVSGNAAVEVIEGGVWVNSDCEPNALETSSNGTLDADQINVVGEAQGSGFIGASPTEGAGILPDPLAHLDPPSSAGLTYRGQFSCGGGENRTLQPGIYDQIQIGGGCNATLTSGTYVLKGGQLSIGGGGNITGSEVFMYMGSQNFPSVEDGGNVGQVNISGNGSMDLTPPTSGPYQGILLFMDRGKPSQMNVSGNGSIEALNGTIYGANSEIVFSGNAGLSELEAQVIANHIQLTGDGEMTIHYDQEASGGTPAMVLVE